MVAAPIIPMIVSGCGHRVAQAQEEPKPSNPEDVNLDDVDESAIYRPLPPVSEPIMRVRVMKVRPQRAAMASSTAILNEDSAAGTSLLIGSEDQWIRIHRENGPVNGTALKGPLQVAMEPTGWSIIDSTGIRAAVEGRETIEFSALDDFNDGMLIVRDPLEKNAAASKPQSRQYPVTLRLFSRHDLAEPPKTSSAKALSDKANDSSNAMPSRQIIVGAFDVMNDVPLETYLPGVLAGELFKAWQLETFAAQAVAARSYAFTESTVFAGRRHYDVSSTASSQMYVGGGAHQKAKDAVKLTRGLMLTYESLVVSGYYSSCCGGVAASAADAIGVNAVNDVLPLQGRVGTTDACVGAPVFQWKVEHPVELLTRRINGFGQEKKNKDLMNLSRVTAIETTAINVNGRPTRIRISDENKKSVEITAEDFRRAANWSGGFPNPVSPPEKPLKSSNFKATFTRDVVSFEGYGFGHGAGLCQYGAEALAKAGQDHQSILNWYYPGAELTKAYS